jgi:hypothetical protein
VIFIPAPKNQEEYRKWIQKLKGRTPWNKGLVNVQTSWNKGLTKNTSEVMKKAADNMKGKKKGIVPKMAFKKGQTPWNKDKKGLQVAWNKGRPDYAHRGPNNSNWKGGVWLKDKTIRTLLEYKIWRTKCFERDNWTCQNCRVRGKYLTVHHIKSVSSIIRDFNINNIEDARNTEILWDLDNGVTLCEECHSLTDSYKKKFKN